MSVFLWGIIVFSAWNLLVFIIYGADKSKARNRTNRIRERTLIICAFLMGAIGAGLGMSVFRHKTLHVKFRILVPLALLFNIGLAVGAYYLYISRMY